MIKNGVGASDANSYVTLSEFESYCTYRIPTIVFSTDDDFNEALLRTATRVLDASFVWTGTAVDGDQALCWPRRGMTNRNGFPISPTSIPEPLKHAQMEFAAQLKESADRLLDNDAAKMGLASVSAGSVSLSFRETETASNREMLDAVLKRMGPEFGYASRAVPDAVRLILVPSWYVRESILGEATFDVIT